MDVGLRGSKEMGTLLHGILFCTVVVATHRRENIINSLLNDSYYNSRVPPNYEDNFPTNVTIQLYLLSFHSVQEISMDYSMTIFLRVQWTDERLQWEDHLAANDTDHGDQSFSASEEIYTAAEEEVLDHLEVDSKLMDGVWMPDIYFLNDKKAEVHDVTMINRMLVIYRNGSIQTSSRISLTLSCDMHLKHYPHDEQICSISIGSYSYSAENVMFHWHPRALVIREGVTLPRFSVELRHTGYCQYTFTQGSMISGKYACITADFKLVREFGYYIAQVYVPSALIVMLSWVSFWIDLDAIPARVSLGLLTVLTMTTHTTGEKSTLPRVSYIKAIDVWMASCLAFVFAALLEFAYVNVQSRVEKRYSGGSFMSPNRLSKSGTGPTSSGSGTFNGRELDQKSAEEKKMSEETAGKWNLLKRHILQGDVTGLQRARMVDKCSRVFFPISFLIFNLIYWIVFKAAASKE